MFSAITLIVTYCAYRFKFQRWYCITNEIIYYIKIIINILYFVICSSNNSVSKLFIFHDMEIFYKTVTRYVCKYYRFIITFNFFLFISKHLISIIIIFHMNILLKCGMYTKAINRIFTSLVHVFRANYFIVLMINAIDYCCSWMSRTRTLYVLLIRVLKNAFKMFCSVAIIQLHVLGYRRYVH